MDVSSKFSHQLCDGEISLTVLVRLALKQTWVDSVWTVSFYSAVTMCMVTSYHELYAHERTTERRYLCIQLLTRFSGLYCHPSKTKFQFVISARVSFFHFLTLTTSCIQLSHSDWASKSLTMSIRPCSAAHIKAVLPSSSCILISAPASSSIWTMSMLPWDTASISAVWQCWMKRKTLCSW